MVVRKSVSNHLVTRMELHFLYGSLPKPTSGESSGLGRHEKITFDRFVEFGPTPNCTACQEGLHNHTKECRERFDGLIKGSKFEFPDGIPSDRDSWKVDGDKLIRYHSIKRKRLFAPTKTFELPIPKERIGKRVTRIRFEEGGEHDSINAEEWRGNTKALKGWWTGASIFDILGEDIPIPIEVHDPTSFKKERREKVLKQHGCEGYGIFIECCCDPNSGLGAVSGRIGVKHIRMTGRFLKSLIAGSVERAWVCRSWPVGFITLQTMDYLATNEHMEVRKAFS